MTHKQKSFLEKHAKRCPHCNRPMERTESAHFHSDTSSDRGVGSRLKYVATLYECDSCECVIEWTAAHGYRVRSAGSRN